MRTVRLLTIEDSKLVNKEVGTPKQSKSKIFQYMEDYAQNHWGDNWDWRYDKHCLFPHYIASKDGDCLMIY